MSQSLATKDLRDDKAPILDENLNFNQIQQLLISQVTKVLLKVSIYQ